MSERVVVHAVDSDAEAVGHVAKRLKSRGLQIVDTQPHMLLVDGRLDVVCAALRDAHGWKVSAPVTVPRPRVRPRVLKKPD